MKGTPLPGILVIGLLAVTLLFNGCQSNLTKHSPPIEILLSAPQRIHIGGHYYALECYLWRDFMPTIPAEPNGSLLMARATVMEIDSLTIPSNIDAERLWIINGDEVWETEFVPEEDELGPPIYGYRLIRFAQGGPRWGPNIFVHAIVGITDGKGRTYLLRASDQLIHRTD